MLNREATLNTDTLSHVRSICDKFVYWQAPSGGIDFQVCSYHRDTPLGGPSAWGQELPWLARCLYTAADLLDEPMYKAAADGYALFFIAALYDTAPAFALGGALEPCYKLYREHNPGERSLEDLYFDRYDRKRKASKVNAIYRWLLTYRTENDNYFDCGYPWWDNAGTAHPGEDVGYSCDLSDVGRGLVAYYQMFGNENALTHATGLAGYYTRDFKAGTVQGLWSEEVGTWLIGPRHVSGFENLTGVYADEAGWAFSTYYVCLFLSRLHDLIENEELKGKIRHQCVSSLKWMFDACQFEDGAIGMHARDDKWLGTTAMAIMQYLEVYRRFMLDKVTHQAYYPRALKALEWLKTMSSPQRFPPDGYIPVTGISNPWPGWNTPWMMALAAEGLMASPALESLPKYETVN